MVSCEAGLDISRLESFSLTLFSSPHLRAFCAKLIAEYSVKGRAEIPLMVAELEGEAAEEVSSAYSDTDDISSPVPVAEDLLKKLGLLTLKDELTELSAKANAAADPAERSALMKDYTAKFAELQKLTKA
jgi:hypothetical protein